MEKTIDSNKPEENDNVAFEDLSADWVCPLCQAGKDVFEKIS